MTEPIRTPNRAVCRLGLASRGSGELDREAVLAALDRGISYLNWCGQPDGMRDAIRQLGVRRRQIRIAVQLEARTADDARREFESYLAELNTDYLDVVTYYYVEAADEWAQITAAGGAAEIVEAARAAGLVRAIGLTSHQRTLAARIATSGRLDLLMIRYNAAHRGAEQDVFPVATQIGLPVVAFTCLRWGELLRPTPDDPPGFLVPRAAEWYRFVLRHPAVSVALMAPTNAQELADNLALLDEPAILPDTRYEALAAHGERVRRYATNFP